METSMLAAVRAADRDTLYSLYFPAGGRVPAAAVVGCVCLDDLRCTECERILGVSFLAIELAVCKKQRTDPPIPAARVEVEIGQGPGPGSHGVEGSDAAISGMVDRLRRGSHPPPDGDKGSDAGISGTADRIGPGSHLASHAVEGFEAAISGMAARLGLPAAVGERAKDMFRKMEEARAWPHGPGRTKFRSNVPLAYAACLSIACRNEGSARSLRELALATVGGGGEAAASASAASRWEIGRLIAHIRKRLGEEEAGVATGIGIVSVSSYVRRFFSLLGMGEAAAASALEAARRLEEGVLDVRHNAESVAAAVVCLALERAGAARQPVKDVAAATGITYATIYRVSSSLRPQAGLLFG